MPYGKYVIHEPNSHVFLSVLVSWLLLASAAGGGEANLMALECGLSPA